MTSAPTKSARYNAFWTSFEQWDRFIDYARITTWAAVVAIVVAGTVFQDWSSHTKWVSVALSVSFGFMLYGISALRLKCHLVFRLLIAAVPFGQFASVVYLVLNWPAGVA